MPDSPPAHESPKRPSELSEQPAAKKQKVEEKEEDEQEEEKKQPTTLAVSATAGRMLLNLSMGGKEYKLRIPLFHHNALHTLPDSYFFQPVHWGDPIVGAITHLPFDLYECEPLLQLLQQRDVLSRLPSKVEFDKRLKMLAQWYPVLQAEGKRRAIERAEMIAGLPEWEREDILKLFNPDVSDDDDSEDFDRDNDDSDPPVIPEALNLSNGRTIAMGTAWLAKFNVYFHRYPFYRLQHDDRPIGWQLGSVVDYQRLLAKVDSRATAISPSNGDTADTHYDDSRSVFGRDPRRLPPWLVLSITHWFKPFFQTAAVIVKQEARSKGLTYRSRGMKERLSDLEDLEDPDCPPPYLPSWSTAEHFLVHVADKLFGQWGDIESGFNYAQSHPAGFTNAGIIAKETHCECYLCSEVDGVAAWLHPAQRLESNRRQLRAAVQTLVEAVYNTEEKKEERLYQEVLANDRDVYDHWAEIYDSSIRKKTEIPVEIIRDQYPLLFRDFKRYLELGASIPAWLIDFKDEFVRCGRAKGLIDGTFLEQLESEVWGQNIAKS